MSVNALLLNTGERIVIASGIERVSPVMETAGAPWTAIGILGVSGDTVVGLVMEERELELDSVTDLGTEERTALERKKKWSSVTLRAAQWTALGVFGVLGVRAPSPVLERMEDME